MIAAGELLDNPGEHRHPEVEGKRAMTIHGIYENGVFRPTEPVDLPEHTPVLITTAPPPEKTERPKMTIADLERLRGTLKSWPEDPVEGQRRMRDEEWL